MRYSPENVGSLAVLYHRREGPQIGVDLRPLDPFGLYSVVCLVYLEDAIAAISSALRA